LAEREPDPQRQRVLAELAATENRHADRWAARLEQLGAGVPDRATVRLPRSIELSLRFAPVEAVIAHQEAEERRLAASHADLTGDAATDALLAQIGEEDREHAATLRTLLHSDERKSSRRRAQSALDRILGHESWHSSDSGWIGGAIYGVNDGLAAVFGIVSGVSAASQARGNVVLIAGLAGALASAVSMGSGAYLATKSEGEVYEAQLDRERREIEEEPEEERRELELFYQLKGLSEEESKLLADRVSQNPRALLEAMATEELKLGPNPGGEPVKAGVAAMLSTAVGAIIPVVPFFFLSGGAAIITAAVVSILAHFAVGAAKSLVTLRSWWASGLEMTVAGIVVGAVTYVVGLFFHVS
ncbi:MAG TPA: VIT1/CCC1 transporter family protein, partial [Candidatus Dormibacteraeota bacterium]|nr:VIT1/CCC1 transporter family protein [Candidatus Dormibacteraeota bacterium]